MQIGSQLRWQIACSGQLQFSPESFDRMGRRGRDEVGVPGGPGLREARLVEEAAATGVHRGAGSEADNIPYGGVESLGCHGRSE